MKKRGKKEEKRGKTGNGSLYLNAFGHS